MQNISRQERTCLQITVARNHRQFLVNSLIIIYFK
jgi:hypothetical protein